MGLPDGPRVFMMPLLVNHALVAASYHFQASTALENARPGRDTRQRIAPPPVCSCPFPPGEGQGEGGRVCSRGSPIPSSLPLGKGANDEPCHDTPRKSLTHLAGSARLSITRVPDTIAPDRPKRTPKDGRKRNSMEAAGGQTVRLRRCVTGAGLTSVGRTA